MEKIGKFMLGITIVIAILTIGMTTIIGWEQTKIMINFLWKITGGLFFGTIKELILGIINGFSN